MSMSTTLNALTGPVVSGSPTLTSVGGATLKYNREDTVLGTTPLPVPSSGTNTKFSFVKTFQLVVNNANGLTMTGLTVGLLAALSFTGLVLMYTTAHTIAQYTQAVAQPNDDLVHGAGVATVCTINGAAATAMPLYAAASAYAYATLGLAVSGNAGNLVETALGADGTCTQAGAALALATLQFGWSEM